MQTTGSYDPADFVRLIEDNWYSGGHAWRSWSRGEIVCESDMTCLFSPVPSSLFNVVIRTGIDPTDLEQRIRWVIEQAESRSVPISWWVGPQAKPRNLVSHLERAGFRGQVVIGMAATLPVQSPAMPTAEVVEVVDRKTLLAWSRVFSMVYSLPAPVASEWAEMASETALGQNASWRNFVLSVNHVPVSVACLFLNGGTAALAGVGTLTEFRGRGFGTAISCHALEFAYNRGCQLATLFASNESSDLYEGIGFRKYCEGACYTFEHL